MPIIATAASIMIAGCGGGGGGDANVRPDAPELPPRHGDNAQLQRTNPNAIDLGEHWRAPEALLNALNAGDAGGNTIGLSRALAVIDDLKSDTSSMRSITAGDMTPIGTRGDITIGRWTAGPADTFDIDFHYEPGAALSNEDKARIERGGRAWSRYIRTDHDQHTVSAGTEINRLFLGSSTIGMDIEVDDMLIVIRTRTEGVSSYGGSTGSSFTGDTLTPGIGFIDINTGNGDQRNNSVITHEIGHAVIHTEATTEGVITPTLDRYLSADGHFFEGPNAMRANGGEAVPFQWVNADNERVAPGTPGAVIDHGHIDVCTSIMAYCRDNDVVMPSALDIAWLRDMGHETNEADALKAEVYGYGAWGNHSAWGVGVSRHLTGFDTQSDRLEASADAFGVIPNTTLEDSISTHGLSGSATWNGVLLGVDMATDAFSPVSGDAMLNVNLDSLDGTAEFNNLTAHANGRSTSFRTQRLEYAINIDGNRFGDASQRIEGGFYGPDHDEMAGVLNDDRNSVNLLAGFGGTKDD